MAESERKTTERMFEIMQLKKDLVELKKQFKDKKELLIKLKKEDLKQRKIGAKKK